MGNNLETFEDDDSGFDGGSAYYFDAISGDQISKLLASDGEDLIVCVSVFTGRADCDRCQAG